MFYFGTFLSLLLIGFFFGRLAESRHYRSIAEREAKWVSLPTTNSRNPLAPSEQISHCKLATGSVVISVDYFKQLLAGLRAIFGGPVQSFETLVDRARREALLRMKESCPSADEICNVRIETSSISNNSGNGIGSVEVLAYGTAIYYHK